MLHFTRVFRYRIIHIALFNLSYSVCSLWTFSKWLRNSKFPIVFSSVKANMSVCVCACTYRKWGASSSVMSDSLGPHGLYIYSPWNSPGPNTGVSHLLQGTVPTQWSNPGLPDCRKILSQLSVKGSPRIWEWAAYPFSSGSSRPRNWTGVSCIEGGFFTNSAIREAPDVHTYAHVLTHVCIHMYVCTQM